MYYVYLLKSVNFADKTYIGCTADIAKRIKEHNNDKSMYTAKFKPWFVHACFAFKEKQKAYDFERYLKSHAGIAFANKRFW